MFESDNNFTIRLPPLIANIFAQVFGERVWVEIAVIGRFLVISGAEENEELVGSQQPPLARGPDSVGGLATQRGLHFLRDDAAAEYAGEGIADHVFKLALEALDNSHASSFRRSRGSSERMTQRTATGGSRVDGIGLMIVSTRSSITRRHRLGTKRPSTLAVCDD
nr:hypothetical protein [Mycobacterium sp. D16R24]